MPFTGKATFSAGADLPELMEDVSDIIGMVSPYETPLLDAIGDSTRQAFSTVHEWLEDELLPNVDSINQASFSPNPENATGITVFNGQRFRAGDLLRPVGGREVIQVISVAVNVLTVVRRYGGTLATALTNGQRLLILSSPALEGDDRPEPRSSSRVRRRNFAQIFTASVDISGSMLASRSIGVRDEMDYQKQQRARELLRDLENAVLNGIAPSAAPQGSATVRRSMNGLFSLVTTNNMAPGAGGIAAGGGAGADLNEAVLNSALRQIWESASSSVDLIVCPAGLKRRINGFASASRRTAMGEDAFGDVINIYESDFGTCRVLLSRYMPTDSLLLLDSSRVEVLPLQGRSFGFRKLAMTGDRESGQMVGEYTLELRNELAHGAVRNLT